jgi:hypothetical protein
MLKKANAPMGWIREAGLGKNGIDDRRVMRHQGVGQLLARPLEGIQTAPEQKAFQYTQNVSLVMVRKNNSSPPAQYAMDLTETPLHVTNMLDDPDEQNTIKGCGTKRESVDISGKIEPSAFVCLPGLPEQTEGTVKQEDLLVPGRVQWGQPAETAAEVQNPATA